MSMNQRPKKYGQMHNFSRWTWVRITSIILPFLFLDRPVVSVLLISSLWQSSSLWQPIYHVLSLVSEGQHEGSDAVALQESQWTKKGWIPANDICWLMSGRASDRKFCFKNTLGVKRKPESSLDWERCQLPTNSNQSIQYNIVKVISSINLITSILHIEDSEINLRIV